MVVALAEAVRTLVYVNFDFELLSEMSLLRDSVRAVAVARELAVRDAENEGDIDDDFTLLVIQRLSDSDGVSVSLDVSILETDGVPLDTDSLNDAVVVGVIAGAGVMVWVEVPSFVVVDVGELVGVTVGGGVTVFDLEDSAEMLDDRVFECSSVLLTVTERTVAEFCGEGLCEID